jgi:hypothetical protein
VKKSVLLFVLLALAPAVAEASPYLRPIDINHPQTGAVSLYRVRDRSFLAGVADLALVTHSNADGSLVPTPLQKYIAPEPWVPLQIGFGGSVTKNAYIHLGTSYNVGAQLASSIIKLTGTSANPTARAVTDFLGDGLVLSGGSTLGFAAGVGLAGQIVEDGHFQNVRAAFPGCGPGAILENAAAYSLGLAWKL